MVLDNLRRIRVPATWIMVGLVAVTVILGVVNTALTMASGADIFTAARIHSTDLLNLSAVILLIVVICTGIFLDPVMPGASMLTRLSAYVVSVGAVLTAIATGLGLVGAGGSWGIAVELLGGLLDCGLKLLAAGALWVLAHGLDSGRMHPLVSDSPLAESTSAIRPAAEPQASPEVTGTAWLTAGEAAAGLPGNSSLDPHQGAPLPENSED